MIDLIYLMLGTFMFALFLNQELDLGSTAVSIAILSFVFLLIGYLAGRQFKKAWDDYRREFKSKDEWDR